MKSKVITLLVIVMILMLMIPSNVFADYTGINKNITIGGTDAISSSVDMTESILGIIQVAGTVISIIALIIIGMRYMFSTVEGKAGLKDVLVYYVIGAILVFATSNVLGFAYDIFTNLDKKTVVTGQNVTYIKNCKCGPYEVKERDWKNPFYFEWITVTYNCLDGGNCRDSCPNCTGGTTCCSKTITEDIYGEVPIF